MHPFNLLMDQYLLSVPMCCHPMEALRARLNCRGFFTKEDLLTQPSGKVVRTGGLLVMVHTPPTRSGKRVMFITTEDETGLLDLVAFEDVQRRWAKEILCSRILLVEGVLRRQGRGQGALTVVVKRVLPEDGLEGVKKC